jgi:hypothetical protein
LDGKVPKASASSGDQHGVAFLDFDIIKQDVGCNTLDKHCDGKRMIQSCRKRNRCRSRDYGVSCISATLNNGRNGIALFETFHALADALHHPSNLKAHRERSLRNLRVETGPSHDVRIVDAYRFYLDQQSSYCWSRCWRFHYGEHFRPTKL